MPNKPSKKKSNSITPGSKRSGKKSQKPTTSTSGESSGTSTVKMKSSQEPFSSLVQISPKGPGLVEIAVGRINGLQGRFKLSGLGMKGVLTEVLELPEEFHVAAPLAPKHIVCVKKGDGGCDFGLLFGDDFLIDNVSVVAGYWPETQELECFHCVGCGVIVLDWIKAKQHEWYSVFSRRIDESTGEGPKRTTQ